MNKRINWGFFPDKPVKTQSIIEILLVIVIFAGCLRLFFLWYRVPEREFEINVEDLEKELGLGLDLSMESKYCNIYFQEQQTLDENKIDSTNEDLKIYFHKFESALRYNDLRVNHVMLNKFKRSFVDFDDEFEFKNERALSHFIQETTPPEIAKQFDNKWAFVAGEAEYIDSLKQFCESNFKKVDNGICYVKFSQKEKFGLYNTGISDFELKPTSYARRMVMPDKGYIDEMYLSQQFSISSYSCYSHSVKSARRWYQIFHPNSHAESPNILTVWDISQSYYKFRVKSLTIDSMNIKIDFKGASEFSRIYPEPDEIGISYIKYTNPNKLSLLKRDGIEFLVKFKDLEGYQQIRLFALTGIMGGFFTVLIFFLFLYPTKIYRQYKVIRDQKMNEKNKVSSSKESPLELGVKSK